MIRGSASVFDWGHWRNSQIASKALPDIDLPELLSHLQQLKAHSILDLDIWPAAYAAEATTPALEAAAPVLDPNTKYVLGPDGNPVIDMSNNKPIVEDWYQLVVSLQVFLVKGIDATLRKVGVPQAFGWTIVVYTLFIKVVTYPLQKASTQSTTMMKITQPKIEEIAKNDSYSEEEKARMTSVIYDVAEANPFSGCLPVLLTFPIYFTLISAWRRLAYEKFPYYSESWLWIPSLSQPNPDFRMNVDWLTQFNAAGDPFMGWHDYLSYLVLPSILVINTIITSFQNAKKDGKQELPTPLGITLFLVVLVGSIALDLPQAYGVYYLANQVFTALQTYVANVSMRSEIPDFEEYEKTGKFPASTLDNMALKKAPARSLHEAAQNGRDDAVVAFLDDESVDIDALDERKVTPIGYAVARGRLSTMKLLIDRGANMQAVDDAGHTLFHFAAFSNKAKVMKELVEVTRDIYPDNSWAFLSDQGGITPLGAASLIKDPEMMDLFEGLGLKMLELPEEPASTSLHEAAQNGNDDAVVAFLDDQSVDIDAWDEQKVTPISYAVARGHLSTLKLLLSRGANVQALDGAGHTLFHFAAFYNRAEVMKELMQISKDTHPDNSWAFVRDQGGQTPMDVALLRRDPEMMTLFQGLGLLPDASQPMVTANEPAMITERMMDATTAAAAVATALPTDSEA
eukprot:CAMPEP_0180556370 /NCGR_PEP_ID=MMETSP1037_2-20121125/543_1 /TAXON_ID=632150 /ORGANISM="Azadinium spinosum, Strain 3D9" /LENGTH=683 /DNA_ID=CAMNT_0022572403 /DNA_START=242 /DNA_END=2290 /DNA_ORIENTATION=-